MTSQVGLGGFWVDVEPNPHALILLEDPELFQVLYVCLNGHSAWCLLTRERRNTCAVLPPSWLERERRVARTCERCAGRACARWRFRVRRDVDQVDEGCCEGRQRGLRSSAWGRAGLPRRPLPGWGGVA